MQEEISNQIVVILKNTGRLTAQALKHAIIKAVIEPEQKRAALQRSKQTAAENEKVRQKMRQKERKQIQKKRPHGKMKVKELVAQGKGVKSFEISGDSRSKFISTANKMGVDFAVETAENGNTMVFYKPNDIEIITAVQQHTMGKKPCSTLRKRILIWWFWMLCCLKWMVCRYARQPENFLRCLLSW